MKKRTALLAFMAGGALLAACGSSSSNSSPTTQAGAVTTISSPTTTTGKALTVGLVFNTATDPNQQRVADGMKAEAATAGWTVKTADANNDAAKANDLMTAYVNQKVDAIVTQVFPADALKQGIQAANDAGIPVIMMYAYGTPEGVAAVVSQAPGTAQTKRMVADLGGTGKVLAFTFRPGAPCVQGEKDFDAVMAANPGISVQKQEVPAPGWEQAGSNFAATWLQGNPEGSGNLAIWGCWDGPTLGAISALKQAGRSDVKVYGAFGEAGAIAAVKSGTMTATYWYDSTKSGSTIIKTIGDIVKAGKASTPINLLADPVEVDATSITKFLEDNPKAAG